MSKIKVCFAPGAGKALVYEGLQGDCWLIDLKKEVPEREPAPHMHNLRMDGWYQEKNMEEGFPYPNARQELELWSRRHRMLYGILSSFDVALSVETRKTAAKTAGEYVGEPEVFGFVTEMLFSRALPKEADIKDEVVGEMCQKLQVLIRAVVKYWRG